MEHSLWQTVLGEIELSVSRAAYMTWFKKTELIENSPTGDLVVAVPNIFAKQQFEVKFDAQIQSILKKNGVAVQANGPLVKNVSWWGYGDKKTIAGGLQFPIMK